MNTSPDADVEPPRARDDTASPPDWSRLERVVLCPLCDYNLRGLTEPRCPECGYAYRWVELLDANVGLHPYLFEHHPRRQVRALIRTWLGGLRPSRFWRSIAPTQPISTRHLLWYWAAVATLIVVVGFGAQLTLAATRRVHFDSIARRSWLGQYANPADPATVIVQPGLTLQQVLDQNHPPPRRPLFWAQLFLYESDVSLTLLFLLAAALWPGLTLATLLIFIASIQRARIKWAHVLRCSVYCGDVFLILGLVALRPAHPVAAIVPAALLLAVVVTWRLIVAFRVYLRFRHAAATALASQIIVLLLVLVVILQNRNAYELIFVL